MVTMETLKTGAARSIVLAWRLPAWQRLSAAVTGALLGAGLGLSISQGDPVTVLFSGVTIAILVLLVPRLLPASVASAAVRIVTGAYALRIFVATVLYYGALAVGRNGYITGDDLAYSQLAWGWVQWLLGTPYAPFLPPSWGGNAYLFSPYVYLEAALYFVFGPQVLLMEFVNAGLAAATLVLIGRIANALFGRRPALAAMALVGFFPALVLWSSLNLKDALILILVSVVMLSLPQFTTPSIRALVLGYLALFPLISLRLYIFTGLALVVPAAWLIFRHPSVPSRLRWSGAAGIASAILLGYTGTSSAYLDPLATLAGFQHTRTALAANARTGYVEPPPVAVIPNGGETFVVLPVTPQEGAIRPEGVQSQAPAPTPARSPSIPQGTAAATISAEPQTPPATPSPTPRVVYVGANTKLILETPSPSGVAVASPGPPASSRPLPTAATPAPTIQPPTAAPASAEAGAVVTAAPTAPDVVYVRPGDIVVVGPPGTAPLPESQRQQLSLTDLRGVPSARFASATLREPEALVVSRTFSYLPRGVVYALFAPFPWDARRALDLGIEPELLLWYVILAGALATAWNERRRWREIAPLVMYVAGFLLVFSMAEGNVGTLYRHRGMVIPFAIVLASPALATWAQAIGPRFAGLRHFRPTSRGQGSGFGPAGGRQPGVR